jgi:hypothetical protein
MCSDIVPSGTNSILDIHLHTRSPIAADDMYRQPSQASTLLSLFERQKATEEILNILKLRDHNEFL